MDMEHQATTGYIVREQKLPPAQNRWTYDYSASGVASHEGSHDQLPNWDFVPDLYSMREAADQLRWQATMLFRHRSNVLYVEGIDDWDGPAPIEWEGPGYYAMSGEALYVDGSYNLTDGDCLRMHVVEVEVVKEELWGGYVLETV